MPSAIQHWIYPINPASEYFLIDPDGGPDVPVSAENLWAQIAKRPQRVDDWYLATGFREMSVGDLVWITSPTCWHLVTGDGAVGHYCQGRLGRSFFSRLRIAEVLPPPSDDWEDDVALAQGLGFNDIIKRPTARASDLTKEEYTYGLSRLYRRLTDTQTPLVIFTFKKTAEVILGRFDGSGLLASTRVGDAQVFVMPGPYAAREVVGNQMDVLRAAIVS